MEPSIYFYRWRVNGIAGAGVVVQWNNNSARDEVVAEMAALGYEELDHLVLYEINPMETGVQYVSYGI